MKIYFSKYESSSTKILSGVTSAKQQTCDLCLWNSQQQVHLMMRQCWWYPLRLYLSLPYSLHIYQHSNSIYVPLHRATSNSCQPLSWPCRWSYSSTKKYAEKWMRNTIILNNKYCKFLLANANQRKQTNAVFLPSWLEDFRPLCSLLDGGQVLR